MTRLRYKKISTNVYQLSKPILLGQYMAHVVINVDTKTAIIYDGSHNIYTTEGKDFTTLKRLVRTALKANGASLTDEVRKVIK